MMITIKIYMHLWHVRMVTMKFLVEILVTVKTDQLGLDSGAKCHMTPQYSDFIPGSLEDTDI